VASRPARRASPNEILQGALSAAPTWFLLRESAMATKLEKTLKRELDVNGEAYILTISPEGLKLVRKGKRKGQELAWKDLTSGQAALAVALNASLEQARS
jgi:hypothetical protein